MKLSILGLRKAVGWLAVIGILGNQMLFDLIGMNEIYQHNQLYEQVWEPSYPKLLNPLYPFLYIDEWGLLNHIFGWTGLLFAVLWFILLFAFPGENAGARSLKDRLGSLYEPLLLEPFEQKELTNTTTGQKITIKKTKGFSEYFTNVRFWPIAMLTLNQMLLGLIGIMLWGLLFISATHGTSGSGSVGIFLSIYFIIGFLVAANKHKYMLYVYRGRGWSEEMKNSEKAMPSI